MIKRWVPNIIKRWVTKERWFGYQILAFLILNLQQNDKSSKRASKWQGTSVRCYVLLLALLVKGVVLVISFISYSLTISYPIRIFFFLNGWLNLTYRWLPSLKKYIPRISQKRKSLNAKQGSKQTNKAIFKHVSSKNGKENKSKKQKKKTTNKTLQTTNHVCSHGASRMKQEWAIDRWCRGLSS